MNILLGILMPLVWLLVIVAGTLAFAWIQLKLPPRKSKTSPRRVTGPSALKLRREMQAPARPTLLLAPSDAPVFSKLGGATGLDDRMAWPTSTVIHRFPRREADARAGDFSKIQMVRQSH